MRTLDDINFIKIKFEILSEEDEEIDIDSIEEIKQPSNDIAGISYAQEKINELIRAVKQLNNNIPKIN